MEYKKVSIIVPVYNTAKYLEKCFKSISSQTYKNIEIIVVNDGSPDNSDAIITAFIEQEPRAIYIKQNNQGVSVARNNGVSIAQGDYILFCDSDDYYPEKAVETLANKAAHQEADIVIGNYYEKTRLGNRLININRHETPIAFLESMVTGRNHGGPCNKLFTKQILQGVFFKPGIHYREDILFLAEILLKASRISYTSDAVYVYAKRKGSAVHSINERALKSSEAVTHQLETMLKHHISASMLGKMLALDAYFKLLNSRHTLSQAQLELYTNRLNGSDWGGANKIAIILCKYNLNNIIYTYKKIKNLIDNAISY